jgi:hypothetical protein
MLEEKRNMLGLMATHAEQSGNLTLAEEYKNRANEAEKHAEGLKVFLTKLSEKVDGVNIHEKANS